MTKRKINHIRMFHEEMKKYEDKIVIIFPYMVTEVKKNGIMDYYCLRVESDHLIYDKIVSSRPLELQILASSYERRIRTSKTFAKKLDLFYRINTPLYVMLNNFTKELHYPVEEMDDDELDFMFKLFDIKL